MDNIKPKPSVLRMTLNMLMEMLERQLKAQAEKLSDYEKYPTLESQDKGEILGFIQGLKYAMSVVRTQLEMVDLAEDLTGSREC